MYQPGDTVLHWTYGSGKVVAIEEDGIAGQPLSHYVIETGKQTLWVPVEDLERSWIHQLTSRADFKLLINILRSQGENLSNNPYQRRDQLAERMQKASPQDICRIIRDLTYRAHSRKLSSSDIWVLQQAQSALLYEWEQCLGTQPDKARYEMEWILRGAAN